MIISIPKALGPYASMIPIKKLDHSKSGLTYGRKNTSFEIVNQITPVKAHKYFEFGTDKIAIGTAIKSAARVAVKTQIV
jgi:hypothetical protein